MYYKSKLIKLKFRKKLILKPFVNIVIMIFKKKKNLLVTKANLEGWLEHI